MKAVHHFKFKNFAFVLSEERRLNAQMATITPSSVNIALASPTTIIKNVAPKTYYGYKFVGTSSNYIQVPRTTSIEPTAQITYECRMRLGKLISAYAATVRIIHKWSDSLGIGYELFLNPPTNIHLRIRIGALPAYDMDYDITSWTTSEIHHVAVAYDGADLNFYIDGAVGNTTPATGVITHTATDLYFGIYKDGAGPLIMPFTGMIDEVRIWNYGRSQAQVQAAMLGEIDPGTSGLVGYWKFNEDSGTVAHESTNVGTNDGTINGATRNSISYQPTPAVVQYASNSVVIINSLVITSPAIINYQVATSTLRLIQHAIPSVVTLALPPPTLIVTIYPTTVSIPITVPTTLEKNVAPKTYYAYKFNGTNSDYIQVPRTTSIEPTAQITVEFRLRLGKLIGDYVGTPRLVHKWSDALLLGYEIFLFPPTFIWSRLSIAGTKYERALNITSWDTSTIHHAAITYDGVNFIFYVDSIVVDTVPVVGGITHTATDLYFAIYENGGPLSQPYQGMIDEVRIWSIARSQPQISANMMGEIDPGTSGLVGYWKLNEDSGTVAHESTNVGTNDGTINGATRNSISYQPTAEIIDISAQAPSVAITKIYPTSTVININANSVKNNLTIYPDSAIATFTSNGIRAVQIIHPSPAVANFSTNSIQANMTIIATPAIINFVVGTPTIRLTQHATESIITLSLPPPTLTLIINPTPAVMTFSTQGVDINLVIYPTAVIATFTSNNVKTNLKIYSTPAVATFSSNGITTDYIIYPTPAVATFSSNGVSTTLKIYPTSSTANFSANGIGTTLRIYPDAATMTFSTNGITVDYVLYPTPAIAIFSAQNPMVVVGLLILPDPAVSTFSIPTPNTMIINVKINFTVKIFNELNYQVIIERI